MQTSADITEKIVAREYNIKRLAKDNLPDLAWLHSKVYGVDQNTSYFIKKYETGYTGVSYVGFIAYNNDNTPIAYYGVIPCLIESGTDKILAAQSADTMTHPSFRFKGMFVELSLKTFELCKKLNILLIFGFPNQNSYHGAVNKLGWTQTEAMECFLIPVKTIPFSSYFLSSSFLKRIYKWYSQRLKGNKLTNKQVVSSSVSKNGFAAVLRNEEYGKYKQFSPGEVLSINNAMVWLSSKPGMLIGDMENITESNFDAVINSLKKLAAWSGIKQLQFHTSTGTSLHTLFKKSYQPIRSYPVLFQDFGASINPEKVKFTFADIDIF